MAKHKLSLTFVGLAILGISIPAAAIAAHGGGGGSPGGGSRGGGSAMHAGGGGSHFSGGGAAHFNGGAATIAAHGSGGGAHAGSSGGGGAHFSGGGSFGGGGAHFSSGGGAHFSGGNWSGAHMSTGNYIHAGNAANFAHSSNANFAHTENFAHTGNQNWSGQHWSGNNANAWHHANNWGNNNWGPNNWDHHFNHGYHGGYWGPGWGGWGWGWGFPWGISIGWGYPYYGGYWADYVCPYGAYSTSYPTSDYAYNYGNQGEYTVASPVATPEDQLQPPADNQQQAPSEALQYYNEARAAFAQNNFREALRLAGHAGVESPQNPKVHELTSLALLATGDYRGAATEAHMALAFGSPSSWADLYSYYNDVEKYTDQLRKLEKAVADNPKSGPAQFLLGYQYLMTGAKGEAKDHIAQAAKLAPNDKLAAHVLKQLDAGQAVTPPELPTKPVAPGAEQPKLPPVPAPLQGPQGQSL